MGLNCAIDGPSGAGKSTIAKTLAKKLGFVYVDTGALYRTLGLAGAESKADIHDDSQLEKLLQSSRVELKYSSSEQRVLLNGEDVSEKIRSSEMGAAASEISAIPRVREHLLDMQRDMAKSNNVIMDGRDIGTVVLPNADVKIFLTASPECRARRRLRDLEEKGEAVDYDEVLQMIIKRDYQDSHRETAPLKPADDSILIDTTELDLEQSADKIISVIAERTGIKI